MIIIATEEEKMQLEKSCDRECEKCLLKFLSDFECCPIDNRQIVATYKSCENSLERIYE